ncbi:hypothetical protein [Tepidimonas sp. HKU79]
MHDVADQCNRPGPDTYLPHADDPLEAQAIADRVAALRRAGG